MRAIPLHGRIVVLIRRTVQYINRAEAEGQARAVILATARPLTTAIDAALESAIAADGESIVMTNVIEAERALRRLEAHERAEVARRAFLPRLTG